MINFKQWITWTTRTDPQTGKVIKLPTDPRTGKACNAHDSTLWVSHTEAVATGRPVAFVFTDHDPYFFLDIDDCREPDGSWSQTAAWLCQSLAGCAVEVSQSGSGLHIFGTIPPDCRDMAHGCDSKVLGSQFYTGNRFAAVTGQGWTGDADYTPDPTTYRYIIDTWFPRVSGPVGAVPAEWTTAPCDDWRGPDDDQELIDRMLRSRSTKSVMGLSVTLRQLWQADDTALAEAYPDVRGDQGRAWDWSQADGALCQHLAFWTGRDCARMDRLWGMSALGQRDKWRDRPEYRQRTILRAVGLCKNVYKARDMMPDPAPEPLADTGGMRMGFQFLAPQDQVELFKGCVYVRDVHRVFTPDGDLLKPDQFKAEYGGYVFALDSISDKTTRNAWEAFSESQAMRFPSVHSTCFRPEHAPGAVVAHEGRRYVNTYVPVQTECSTGDPGPFLDLLGRLMPHPHDRDIILAYMAAVVQYPGVKFQWSPLIQGAQGNGKSFIGSCLAFAVGERYTHMPDPKDLGNVFNSWLCGKLLIVVEEVYTRDRVDTIETLKWMVTNLRVPVQGKGRDQITGDNRANFIMMSNHKDAIIKTKDDRRFAVFYTAQQSAVDIQSAGMGGSYFPQLYAWARGGGYAVVNQYLRGYQIPDALNPAKDAHRAPETTSTGEAVECSRGAVEQHIIEACDEGRPGFCGGWISTMALGRLLDGLRVKMAVRRRGDMLRDLGYIPHQALSNGRVSTVIPYEGGKPCLYLRAGHVALNETCPRKITSLYCTAQGYEAGPPVATGVVGVGI